MPPTEKSCGNASEARPEPLRGTDTGSFAESTIRVRLRNIGLRTLNEGSFSAAQSECLQALLDDLPDGRIRALQDQEAPDSEDWSGYIKPYLGFTWLQAPWFFTETYFYRRLLEATGYFVPGEGHGVDPYSAQKRQGLEKFIPAIQTACRLGETWLKEAYSNLDKAYAFLPGVIGWMVWGNQADLSMWPVSKEGGVPSRPEHANHPQAEGDPRRKYLICDDTTAVLDYIHRSGMTRIDIILDNSGLELVYDLLAVNFFLQTGMVGKVCLHAKSHPTFVSDATPADIEGTLEFMLRLDDKVVRNTGEQIRGHFKNGTLRVDSDYYWTSPLAFWDAPRRIRQRLSDSSLVISKGDANYRRFLGDRHWRFDLAARDALGYLDFPFLALRVLKSDIVVGMQPGQAQQLDVSEPNWMTNGRWGLVQLVEPDKSLLSAVTSTTLSP